MILDGFLTFTGDAQGATGTIAVAGTIYDAPTTGTQNSSNVIDLGVTNGIPTSANGGGARDIGIGDDPMLKLLVQVSTTFVYGAGGGTTYIILAGAPDSGTGTEGSYTTMWTSPTYAQADMTAGAQLANVDVPLVIPGQALPRYLRLTFVTATATYTAGQIYGGVVIDRFDQTKGTTGALSGYRAGVTVSN